MFSKLNNYADSARDTFEERVDEVAERLGYRREHSAGDIVGQTACALGSMALGAAAMYFLDPVSGRRRRALVGDKFNRYFNQGGRWVSKKGKHWSNRAKGMVAETRGFFRGEGEAEPQGQGEGSHMG
ncbi:MAG TPA: hypothetical protein VIL86_08935 [Tepidisphaeraceae bacterium]|jgi:hypothetical protein